MLLVPCPDLLYWPSARIPQLLWCWRLKAHSCPFSLKNCHWLNRELPGLLGFFKVGKTLWGSLCSLSTRLKPDSSWEQIFLLRSSSTLYCPLTPRLLRVSFSESKAQETIRLFFQGTQVKKTWEYPLSVVEIHCHLLENVPTRERPFNFLCFVLVPCVAPNQKVYKTLGYLNRTTMRTHGLKHKLFCPALQSLM